MYNFAPAAEIELISRRRTLRGITAWAAWLAGVQTLASAQPATDAAAVRFGVMPLSTVFETRRDWDPLLGKLSLALGQPVMPLLVNSYEALEQAVAHRQVEMVCISGKLALEAVTQHGMSVVAQVTRATGYKAIALTRKTGDFTSLQNLLAEPEKWRIARGEKTSMSGYIVPQLELFLPNNIVMGTRFRDEIVGTHQATALAVVNGEADVSLTNTGDFFLFRKAFPAEAQRLQVIWESSTVPNGHVLVRRTYDAAFRQKVRDFFVHYAQGPDGPSEPLPTDMTGFVAADNGSLMQAAKLDYLFERQRAMTAKWVNEAAREKRLQRIEADYAHQVARLKEQ
jgi:phosphonate transport system substrate-binding protein